MAFVDLKGEPHALRPKGEDELYEGERIPINGHLEMILKQYTKEVFAKRPKDIIAFSADYFRKQSIRQRHQRAVLPLDQGGSVLARRAGLEFRSMSLSIQERVELIFNAFDADESGSINASELLEMLKQVGAFFSFKPTEADAQELLRSVDVNSDQQLSWEEFSSAVAKWLAMRGALV